MRPDCTLCQAGTHHYHASDLGRCQRETVGELLGEKLIPHDEKTLLRFAEGIKHERDVIEDRLPALGYWIDDQQTERVLTLAGVPIMTRVDGRLHQMAMDIGVLNPQRVLEVKAPSPDEYKKWLATRWDTPGLWQNYKWATSCYMLAWESELTFAVKNRSTGEMDVSTLEIPFYSSDILNDRVEELEYWYQRGQLPDTCPRDFFCRMKWSCPRDEIAEEPERQPAPTLIQQYVELGDTIKGLKTQQDVIKAELPGILGDAKSIQWDGGYKATRVVREVKEHVVPANRSEYIQVTKKEGT